jgi:hypothetical protein
MRVKKRGENEWWILGVAEMDPEGMGPYPSKEEAEWHMHAVENTWKYGDRPGYFTVDKDAKRPPVVPVPREPEPAPVKRRTRTPSTTAPVRKKRRKSRKRK